MALSQVSALDPRYCQLAASVPRDASGQIIRSSAVIRAFRKAHPCPVTNLTVGACPGWSIDHVLPLVCGGCDLITNLQWLPNTIKSCAGAQCKDRWEQKVYCTQPK